MGTALAASARVIRAGVGVRVITLDYGGWDMHVGLGSVSNGDMKVHLSELARAVAAFFTDLGSAGGQGHPGHDERVRGGGSRRTAATGTDHGHGNAMLLLGAAVRGGQVHGRWPGLSSGKLIDGDLAVTTDYPGVLSEVVKARFPEASLPTVFPGFAAGSSLGVMR